MVDVHCDRLLLELQNVKARLLRQVEALENEKRGVDRALALLAAMPADDDA